MNRIDLPNRYGDHVYLEQDNNGDWWFTGDDKAFTWHRVVLSESSRDKIRAVDPPGGPFLCIGYIAGDKTVTNIELIEGKGFKVTLEDLHK